MKLTQLFTDDDAVSPVIGVILMVAITVILAAVIGTFVLGLGGNLGSQAPSATLDFNYEAGNPPQDNTYADNRSYTIEHDGGEEVDNSTIFVQETGMEFPSKTYVGGDVHTAGDTIFNRSKLSHHAGRSHDAPSTGDTIQVIWSATESDQSSVLAEDDVPT